MVVYCPVVLPRERNVDSDYISSLALSQVSLHDDIFHIGRVGDIFDPRCTGVETYKQRSKDPIIQKRYMDF